MTVQVGPSPVQLWYVLRAVLTAPARFWRYLMAPVPCHDAPASCPSMQPGTLDLGRSNARGVFYQEDAGLPPGYEPSAALAAGLGFRDNWVYTAGGIISQEQMERLTSYADRHNQMMTAAVLGDFGSGDWRLTDLAPAERDYGIWMTTEEQGQSWPFRRRR